MVMGDLALEADVVVIGAGPGGYVAAIRAADLGQDVVVVEATDKLGGVCLREGCIPSKALINAVEVAHSAREAAEIGSTVENISIDTDTLRAWSQGVVDQLTGGIAGLFKKRGIEVIHGR
ncbi:MAG: FAD-dependent oxidoreductase, partial [Phycisphaeraceae bacterium]|nr:FAD-dependent oxidoreductase [Phycisphaeraceae bacterium]